MKINKIFVSMDGILTNFLYGALKKLGRLDVYNSWPAGQWDIAEVLGMTKKDYWAILSHKAYEFWSTLPATTTGLDACCTLESLSTQIGAELYICTNPTLDVESISGKVKWLQDFFYHNFTQYVVTPRKNTLAAPDSILIDTSENAVNSFIEAGGHGILYPNVDNSYKCVITNELLKSAVIDRIHMLVAEKGVLG
jgi:5'(3')-deoxyribonucleotidase